jgi:cytochrome c556
MEMSQEALDTQARRAELEKWTIAWDAVQESDDKLTKFRALGEKVRPCAAADDAASIPVLLLALQQSCRCCHRAISEGSFWDEEGDAPSGRRGTERIR